MNTQRLLLFLGVGALLLAAAYLGVDAAGLLDDTAAAVETIEGIDEEAADGTGEAAE